MVLWPAGRKGIFLRGLAYFWRCMDPDCGKLLGENIEECDEFDPKQLTYVDGHKWHSDVKPRAHDNRITNKRRKVAAKRGGGIAP